MEGVCVDSMQEAQPSRTIESLAIGTRALRYHSRQADPYEEVILRDATENPMYSTDAVWQGANSDIGDASNVRTLALESDEQEQHEHGDQS